MNNFLEKIRANKVVYSVFLLVTGTGFGHLITFLLLPVLTRYFSPHEFGNLASYIAIIAIVSSVACLRFEIAIPLPVRKKVALSLLVLSVLFALGISLLSIPVIMFYSEVLEGVTGLNGWFLLIIPFGIFFSALFNALQYWFTRRKDFSLIAQTRITQSLSGNSVQLGSGFFDIPAGLLLGHLFYCSAGIFKMLISLIRDEYKALKALTKRNLAYSMKKYKQYPLLSTPEVFANNIGVQFPILFISAYYLSEESGFLLLAMKVMQAPMALVGGSISQVFYSEVAELTQTEDKKKLVERTLVALLKIGVGPILFVGIIAEPLFLVVFGNDWARAGTLVSWCSIWFALQFVSSPVSMIMHVQHKQKSMLMLTLLGGVVRVFPVVFFAFYFNDFVAEVYAVTGAVFYFMCLYVFTNTIGFKAKDLLSIFVRCMKFILPWVFFGFLIINLLKWYGF